MTQAISACEIRTARLVIRCKRPADALLLKHAIDPSLDHLRRWMPWAMHEPSALSVIEARIVRFQREFLSGVDRTYGILNQEGTEILGGIGLHPTDHVESLELGYWLRADATGNGYATEAAAALIQAAFAELGAKRIQIRCDPHNLRSARIPEHLGFRLEKILIANTFTPTGQPRDTMVWALAAEEFAAARANSTA